MSKQQFFCGYLALLITTFFYPGTALSHNDASEQINTSINQIDKADVIVTDAYAQETIPGTNLSSMYMKLKNNGSEELSLVNVQATYHQELKSMSTP
jgi:copper(I)-binding protein